MTSVRQLRYFKRVVELGSITRAAQALHIAQPSLGVQIKLLEDVMKAELLTRHSRGVSPTDAGKILYKRAIEILKEIDALPEEVRSAGAAPTVKSVSLGMPASLMQLLCDDILSDVAPVLPDTRIRLVEERSSVLQKALLNNEIDITLCFDVPTDKRLISVPILEEELLFVSAASGSSETSPISTSELLLSPLVLSGLDGTVHNAVNAQAARLNKMLDPVLSVRSAAALKKLVIGGKATSVLPIGQVIEERKAGSLACRRIEGHPIYRTLYASNLRQDCRVVPQTIDVLIEALSTRLREKLGDLAHPVGGLSSRRARLATPDHPMP